VQLSSVVSVPPIDGNLASSAFERRTVFLRETQNSLGFGGWKSRSSIFLAENRTLQECSSAVENVLNS
jgi:hypothetical protein